MIEYLDHQLASNSVGIHAALQALNQVVEDVVGRCDTITRATSEAIGVPKPAGTMNIGFYQSEIVDLARVTTSYGVAPDPSNEGDQRAIVARAMLKANDEVARLLALQGQLELKWTSREGSEYTPSGLSGALTGGDGGAFMQVLGGQSVEDKAEQDEKDGEMWDALKSLTDTEETLLKGWQKSMVDHEKALRDKQNYAPPGATESQYLHQVTDKISTSAALRYEPHPLEVTNHRDNKDKFARLRARTESKSIEAEQRRLAQEQAAAPAAREAISPSDPDAAELSKLSRLHKFRQSKRQDLFDTVVENSKYASLKIDPEENQDDDSDDEEDKTGKDKDIFAKADSKGEAVRRKLKLAGVEDYGSKFPFRLNRWTIDERMRPRRLWNGGPLSCDMPPLVEGGENAKEVSTVALVVPTAFVGGPRNAGGGHRLIKRATKDVWRDSPALGRAEMDSAGGTVARVPAGNKYTPRAHHPADYDGVASDIDIRKFEDNWGPILMW
jgi:hypothetical protein